MKSIYCAPTPQDMVTCGSRTGDNRESQAVTNSDVLDLDTNTATRVCVRAGSSSGGLVGEGSITRWNYSIYQGNW